MDKLAPTLEKALILSQKVNPFKHLSAWKANVFILLWLLFRPVTGRVPIDNHYDQLSDGH